MQISSTHRIVAAAATLGLTAYALHALRPRRPTPPCEGAGEPTPGNPEGPDYLPRSPRRRHLMEPGTRGTEALLYGRVLTRSCRAIAHALVDIWHADENGKYDEEGFRYRGHVLSDDHGRYRFHTIVPGLYPTRTRHYHVRVQAPGAKLLTTQLYFPKEPRNLVDPFFKRDLMLRVARTREFAARFDFVIDHG